MTLRETTHSVAAAAKILGIARDTCMQAVENGQIAAIRIGKRHRIPDAALRRFIREAGGESPSAASGTAGA
jgi:excisionase family DNA binding protein